MNIGELAKSVATVTGSSEADAKKAITAVFDRMADAAAKGEDVDQWVWQVHGEGPPRAAGSQSLERRSDYDRCFQEGFVHTRQGPKRQAVSRMR